MSENAHTPGPWSAHEKGAHPNPYYVCGAEREYEHGPDKPVVAYIVGTDTHANAHLIAAAPEMLEALKAALPQLQDNARFLRDIQAHAGKVVDAFDAAKAVEMAIAKAQGASS